MANETPPQQWASDPTGRHVQRYWDGSSWTDFVATAAGGLPTTDPLQPGVRWPAPGSDAGTASEISPFAEPVDATPLDRRRGFPAVGLLVVALAVVTGVVLALPHDSRSSTRRNAASAEHGSTSEPPGSTGPAGTPTTTPGSTRPAAAPATTRPPTPSTTGPAPAGSSRQSAAPHSVTSAQDAELADRIVLTLSDFPAGWQANTSAPTHALDFSLPECRRFRDRLAGTNAVAVTRSPDFTKDGQRVSSSVDVLPVQSEAIAVVDSFADPALRRCLGRVFESAARASMTSSVSGPVDVLEVTVQELSVTPVGDESAGVRVVTQATSGGLTVATHADLVALRVGRTAVLTMFDSPRTPFDGPRDAVLRAVATRLRRSGASTR